MSTKQVEGQTLDVDQYGYLTWLSTDVYFNNLSRYLYKFPMAVGAAEYQGGGIPSLARELLTSAGALIFFAIAY